MVSSAIGDEWIKTVDMDGLAQRLSRRNEVTETISLPPPIEGVKEKTE